MHEICLIPTGTGEPGGKETGQKVTHTVEEGGRFDEACKASLAAHPAILYHHRPVTAKPAGRKPRARRNRPARPARPTPGPSPARTLSAAIAMRQWKRRRGGLIYSRSTAAIIAAGACTYRYETPQRTGNQTAHNCVNTVNQTYPTNCD
jgi:hypothetical protein